MGRFENGKLKTQEGKLGGVEYLGGAIVNAATHYIENQIVKTFNQEDGVSESHYLVRGAKLQCTCGSHKRKLNLPLCHGVYVAGKPLVNAEDCLVGDNQNITTFGVCSSEGNPDKPSLVEKAMLIGSGLGGLLLLHSVRKKVLLQKEDGTNVRGYACTPCIVGGWLDAHMTQQIARNNTDGTNPEDRIPALTEYSFLVCAYGGLIEPVTSGQEEE